MGSGVDRFLERTAPARPMDEGPSVDTLLSGRGSAPPLALAVQHAPTDPQRAARVLKASASSGLAQDLVERNLDAIEREDRRRAVDPTAIERTAPKVAGWLAENPQHVAVAADDTERLTWIERQIMSTVDAFTAGRATVKLSALGEKAIKGTITAEERQQVAALQSQMSPSTYGLGQRSGAQGFFGKAKESALNFLETVPAGVANQLPIQPNTMAGSVAGAMIGAGAGLIAGAPSGPGAVATALVGAGTGWEAGAIVQAGRMEASLAYLDYEQLRDDRGQPLPRATILAAAGVVGAVNGVLEGAFGTEAGHAIPGLRALGRESVREALKKQTTRQAFQRFGKAVVEQAGEEGVTEFLQEYVTSWSGAIAKMVEDKQPLSTGAILDRLLDPTYFEAALQSAKAGAQGGGGIAVATAGVSAYEDVKRVKAAQQYANVMTAIGEGVKDSPLMKRMPEAMRTVIERVTKDGPLEHVYAPVEFFQEHFQGAGLAPEEVADELGIRSEYDEAMRTGGKLAIPTAVYATTIAPSEHGTAFAPEISATPDAMSQREAKEYVATRAKLDAEVAAQSPLERSAEQVKAVVASQLQLSGFDQSTAEAYASLYGAAFRSVGERTNQDPLALFQKYGLRIQRPALEQPAPVDVATMAARRAAAIAEKLAAQGKVQEDGVARFEGSRTPGGARRAVAKVSTDGLVHELLDLEEKRADAETRSVYEVREDVSFATSGIPQIVSTKDKAGGPSMQAKAARNLSDYDRATEEIFAELQSRGLQQDDVFARIEDARAALDERAGLEGNFDAGQRNVIRDESGNVLFQGQSISTARPLPGQQTRAEIDRTISIADRLLARMRERQPAPASDQVAASSASAQAASLSPAETEAMLAQLLDSGFATGGGDATVQVPQGQRIAGADDTVSMIQRAIGRVGPQEFRQAANQEIQRRGVKGNVDAEKAAIEETARRLVAQVYEQGPLRDGVLFRSVSGDALSGERNKESRSLQSKVDGTRLGAEVLANLLEGVTLRPEDHGLLSAEAAARMVAQVRRAVEHDPQILRAIVQAVPVNVVDDLFGSQRAAEDALRNETVLKDGATLNADLPVARGADAAYPVRLLLSEVARRAAEQAVVADTGSEAAKGAAASRAGEGYSLSQAPSNKGPRARIRIGEQSIDIELFATADLSSFLHETGHFYAEVLRDMASNPASTQQIRDDYAALERRVGAEPGAVWTREQHETAARLFEAYLMDGKAPTSELRRPFAKFRAWLIGVYRTMARLDVKLTPEVRGVFDRLLATDEEIAAAEQEQHMLPLFADPEAFGMSMPDALRYAVALDEAHHAAQEQLSARLMDDLQREQRQWWKDERAKMRTGVLAELADEPVSRAQVALKSGTMPDGSPLQDVLAAALLDDEGKPRKLDKKALVDTYGKEILPRLKGLYAQSGGITPSEAALLTGFPHGTALVDALANTQPFTQRVESVTDQRMKDEHGDLLTDGRLPVVAMEAVHTEQRAKLLRAELAHLVSNDFAVFKGLQTRISRRIPTIEAVRADAERSIAAKDVRDINPLLYQRAEAKAARLAQANLLKGDIEGAFEEKQRELIAHEHYRAAVAARAEVEKIVDYMRKFDKPSTRQRIGKAGADYLEQIDGLRDRYSFQNVSLVALDRRKSLLAWVKEQEAQGITPEIPEALLIDAGKRSFKEVPLEELQGVRDAVKQIEHLATVKNGLLASARARTLDEARTELVGKAAENFDLKIEPVNMTAPMRAKLVAGMKKGIAAHTRMEFLFRHLDGYQANGPWWSYFFKPMADAENTENDYRRGIAESLTAIMGAYTKEERADWFVHQYVIQGVATDRITNTFTKANILAIALNWGNEYNRSALMEGYGWSQPQVEKILSALDDRDWRTVQAIWDYIDTFRPAAFALEREVTGLTPEKVERSPFTTPSGLEMEGGYYSIAFDREQSSRQTALDLAANVSDMAQGYGARAMTKHGHLKERTNTGGKPLKLELSVISEHLSAVVHDLSFRRAVIDVAKLTRDRDIQAAIEGAAGREMYQQLGPWLASIAGDRSTEPVRFMERIASRARMGVSAVALGLNVVSSVVQTLGFTLSVNEIGPTYALRGIRDAYGKDPQHAFKAGRDFVYERSKMMRDRVANFDRDVRDITRQSTDVGIPGIDPSALYAFISYMDLGVSVPTWLGAYQKAMDGKLAGVEAGEEQAAIDYADMVVRTTQAAGAAKDLALVQRGSQVHKLFTAFYSSMSIQFNQYAQVANQFALSKDVGKLVASAALVWMLPAILEDALRGRGPDDDEDNLAWAARKVVLYPLGSIVILRDFANALERGMETGRIDVGQNAIGTIIESTAKTILALGQELGGKASTRADYRDLSNTVGYLAELPTRQLWKTLEFLYDRMTGTVETHGPFDFLWHAATGEAKR